MKQQQQQLIEMGIGSSQPDERHLALADGCGVEKTESYRHGPKSAHEMGAMLLLQHKNRLVMDAALLEYVHALDASPPDEARLAASFQTLQRQHESMIARLTAAKAALVQSSGDTTTVPSSSIHIEIDTRDTENTH